MSRLTLTARQRWNSHLSSQSTAKSHHVHRQRYICWQISGPARGWVVVIDTSQELGDGRNAAHEEHIQGKSTQRSKREVETHLKPECISPSFVMEVVITAAIKRFAAHLPEKVVCIGKKTHARDDDSGEVIGTGLGRIQCLEHIHVRHLRVPFSTLQRLMTGDQI